jgi:hypothetical protein
MRLTLGLVLFAVTACDDGGGARAAEPLTCQQADQAYGEARSGDLELRELAQCKAEADCVLWEPTLSCNGRLHVRDCPQATHVDKLEETLLRNEVLAGPVCDDIPPDCVIGVSCPNVTAACVSGLCTSRGVQ